MTNNEILETLIAMNTMYLNRLYKVRDLTTGDENQDDQLGNWIALESIANTASKRHSELADKLMNNLRETCF